METLGKILELYISKKNYNGRIKQSELSVDADGVFIDKFYGKDKERSILIASTQSYNVVKQNNIDIKYGELGENIIIDFDLALLKVGMQIKIGEVILEITQKCTICDHLSKIDSKVPTLLQNDRGIFAKVIKSGLIKKGEKIECI